MITIELRWFLPVVSPIVLVWLAKLVFFVAGTDPELLATACLAVGLLFGGILLLCMVEENRHIGVIVIGRKSS